MKFKSNQTIQIILTLSVSLSFTALCIFLFTVYPYPLRNLISPPKFNSSSWINESNCPVCSHASTKYPCIINLSTGYISEIKTYLSDSNISHNDLSGTMSLIQSTCFSGYTLYDERLSKITVDLNYFDHCNPYTTSTILCDNCLNKLQILMPVSNHVFIDLSQSSDGIITYYDIKPHTQFTTQYYIVSIDKVQAHYKLNIEINFY